jgi:hypothetical protein
VYAERAGSHWSGSIDLADQGLWSNGMDRVPSGTLLVVGPLELTQQSWEDSSSHLEMACLAALNSGHRVAVLVDTPSPDSLYNDRRRRSIHRWHVREGRERSLHDRVPLGRIQQVPGIAGKGRRRFRGWSH